MTLDHRSRAPLLGSAPNFRDLGHLATADGRRVRPGRVYRSEILSRLSDADVATLATLGIGLVLDLRQPRERALESNRWPAGAAVETLCFEDRPALHEAQAIHWRDRMAADDLQPEDARAMMIALYRRMPMILHRDLAAVFERLDAPAPPVLLVHCTGGKDRSGVVCALLLHALGVPREAIVDDYLLTRVRLPPERLVRTRLAAGVEPLTELRLRILTMVATVDADYLGAAFEQVQRDFGSVDAYLAGACGLDAARRERLRAALLTA